MRFFKNLFLVVQPFAASSKQLKTEEKKKSICVFHRCLQPFEAWDENSFTLHLFQSSVTQPLCHHYRLGSLAAAMAPTGRTGARFFPDSTFAHEKNKMNK